MKKEASSDASSAAAMLMADRFPSSAHATAFASSMEINLCKPTLKNKRKNFFVLFGF
jgi:hypothetical protein